MEGFYKYEINNDGLYDIYWFDNELQSVHTAELICAGFATEDDAIEYIEKLES